MPRKLYEDLGSAAAGAGLGDKRPQFVIQVLPAQSQEHPAPNRIIDVTPRPGLTPPGPVQTVEVLPSPTDPE
jgi:hypothetical protein